MMSLIALFHEQQDNNNNINIKYQSIIATYSGIDNN